MQIYIYIYINSLRSLGRKKDPKFHAKFNRTAKAKDGFPEAAGGGPWRRSGLNICKHGAAANAAPCKTSPWEGSSSFS